MELKLTGKKHTFDYKPDSRGRLACLVTIYEEAYKFKRLRRSIRGEPHTDKWRNLVTSTAEENEWSPAEVVVFIDLIRNKKRKEVRRFLLENGSSMVRRGKRTRVRRKKK